ncbi:MAG: CBS domain-containing protein [Cupriavidus sp.]|jgi:CBS domain-containing protein|uniref:CBS domain-containing protein n=1 Tax=Cupriavidus pauculus TaxID=82633 RepID=UPI0007838BC9|nr:CBS domain-containing protein [Cupriavidus pauculus]MBU64568.1 CBS domain-containing protein [Cupriavidus sp.]KAB0600765.1 CBS domain-containing protein [Cupriavidus pauculus]MBY4731539.1 CBS domain-containing protein [Cupriavidus pauculus]MCM3604172.1 CBS domain-containing protein [Cupriavidus pauculus]UAL01470.1 CBS domain-containing protein [Cupriavidus pauculus]
MKTARQVLENKASQAIYSISPTATVYAALQLMADKRIGALLVMEHGKIVGILSERDYARKVILMQRTSRETLVREIMTTAVIYVRADQSTDECMVMMTRHRLRHLPVMQGDELIGMLSIGDLVNDIISEQRFTIEQLEHYITGGPR